MGTNKNAIITEANILIRNSNAYEKMSRAINPYGDGNASKRIVDNILYYFNFKPNITSCQLNDKTRLFF